MRGIRSAIAGSLLSLLSAIPLSASPPERDAIAAFESLAATFDVPMQVVQMLTSYTDSEGKPAFAPDIVLYVATALKNGEDVHAQFASLPHDFIRNLADMRLETTEHAFGWRDMLAYHEDPCLKGEEEKLDHARALAGIQGDAILESCRLGIEVPVVRSWQRILHAHDAQVNGPFLSVAHEWQLPTPTVEAMLAKDCSPTQIATYHRTGGNLAYFEGLPSAFSCADRIGAFARLMPEEYGWIFEEAGRRAGVAIPPAAVIEFWNAERPESVPLHTSVPLREERVPLHELEDRIRSDPLGYKEEIAGPESILDAIWGVTERKRIEDIAAFLAAATRGEYLIGRQPTPVQAYRYFQLGVPLEEILPPPRAGADLLLYPEEDHNGAFYRQQGGDLTLEGMRRGGRDPILVVVGTAQEYCEALQHYAGAEVVVSRAHGSVKSRALGGPWKEGTANVTTQTDLAQCHSATAHGAAIFYISCRNAEIPLYGRNMVEHCAKNAPGRICYGAKETVAERTVHVTSWSPFMLRFNACEESEQYPDRCTPTDRDVTFYSRSH